MCSAGYQVCKACNMTASWSVDELSSLDKLLTQYWTDIIISHLNSCESLDGIALKGDLCLFRLLLVYKSANSVPLAACQQQWL